MYLGQTQPAWQQIATAVPQVISAFQTRAPVGVSPQYISPMQQMTQPVRFPAIDPWTIALIAGGALLVIFALMRK